ncbi:MAG TPA: hypothetical protein VLY20_04305 [Nitrospiria bacterium]|nr:hypothetical protein [Nitrospiria bacterium]HUK55860.1 hypothetical protein [Nitrospiria bacterium]
MKNGCRSFRIAALFLISPVIFLMAAFSAMAQSTDIDFSGQVIKVDLAAHQVVAKDSQSGNRMRFTVTETTVITSGTDKKTLGDLQPDDTVDIGYVQSGDQNIADTVTLQPTGG